MPEPREKFTLKSLLVYAWWVLGILLILTYLRGPGARIVNAAAQRGWPGLATTVIEVLQGLAIVALIVIGFFLGLRLAQSIASPHASIWRGRWERNGVTAAKEKDYVVGFPEFPTVWVAVWLGFISIILLVGVIEALAPSLFLADRFPALACGANGEACGDLKNLVVSIFAAGLGAATTTILGYLDHACYKRDFIPRFLPWYLARPLLGMMLGVIFYFVLKGSLLATVGRQSSQDLDIYGLAGFAALVGLFSNRAIQKLREVFETLFPVRQDKEKPGSGQGGGDSSSGEPEHAGVAATSSTEPPAGEETTPGHG